MSSNPLDLLQAFVTICLSLSDWTESYLPFQAVSQHGFLSDCFHSEVVDSVQQVCAFYQFL